MRTKMLLAPALAGGVLLLGACSSNYAVEGAALGAAAGAGVAAIADEDIGTGAAIGAAAGGAGGALVKKNGRCYRSDRNGREYEVRC